MVWLLWDHSAWVIVMNAGNVRSEKAVATFRWEMVGAPARRAPEVASRGMSPSCEGRFEVGVRKEFGRWNVAFNQDGEDRRVRLGGKVQFWWQQLWDAVTHCHTFKCRCKSLGTEVGAGDINVGIACIWMVFNSMSLDEIWVQTEKIRGLGLSPDTSALEGEGEIASKGNRKAHQQSSSGTKSLIMHKWISESNNA